MRKLIAITAAAIIGLPSYISAADTNGTTRGSSHLASSASTNEENLRLSLDERFENTISKFQEITGH